MSLSPSELLKNRFVFFADYPFSEALEINDVLTETEFGFKNNRTGVVHLNIEFDKYPHIFKLLEWWEDRELSDMPDWVIDIYGNYDIRKVLFHFSINLTDGLIVDPKRFCTDECPALFYRDFIPAFAPSNK